jgi:hypothetical protein
MGVRYTGVHYTGVHLEGVIPYRRASSSRASCKRAFYRCECIFNKPKLPIAEVDCGCNLTAEVDRPRHS